MMITIIETLERLWPKKFPDEEAKRWARRFEEEPVDQVVAALEWWNDYQKFAPRIGQIEKRLAEMENESKRTSGQIVTDQRPVDVIRRDEKVAEGVDDWLVIVRHWRAQWLRYHTDAERRRVSITDQRTLDFHDQQDFGFAEKCRSSCTGALIVEWLRADWAQAMGHAVVATPDAYDLALTDLERNIRDLRGEATQRKQSAADEVASVRSLPSLTFRPMPDAAANAQAAKVKALKRLEVAEGVGAA